MNRRLRLVATLTLTASVFGCSAGGGLFSPFETADTSESGQPPGTMSADALSGYLQLMDDLLEGDTVIQAEAFQRVTADEAAQPNTTNRLRLAIALAIPGHAGSNGEHAQRELRELLAAREILLPEERILASLLLVQIEQRILLDVEAQQTQRAAIQSMQEQTRQLEQRAEVLQDENQSLRRQLDEAQNIINEITNIEQSIRER
ncbi:MAG: hypothetical protein PVF63_04740 [Gammaproteobacteria bacterium]|jgi:hypothetical protein